MTVQTTLVLLLLAMGLTTGCAQKMPLISHAHMGHSLTAWHDTPSNEALLVVAEKELAIALQQIDSAAAAREVAKQRRHLKHVLHALNPDRQNSGVGLGYGCIRAAEATLEHLEFAASSADASDNLVISIAELGAQGERIVGQLRAAQNVSALEPETADEGLAHLINQVQDHLRLAAFGAPDDDSDSGLRGLHDDMQAMLDREQDPRYEPLPRRYVLGLVRLPNGQWGYRLPKREASLRTVSHRSIGY